MLGGETMSNFIMRFAKRTSGIESGFIADGITVSVIAAISAVGAALSWIIFGV
jgi:Flp pilus assembly pilin Flp